jgi:hypothetical protein
MHANTSPAAIAYFRSLQNSSANETLDLPEYLLQELEIDSYHRGWVNLIYCGPDNTHGYVNQEPYLNPREIVSADVDQLIESITFKKLDYRFPIDLILDTEGLSYEFKAAIQVDGSKPDVAVPTLKLPGVTLEEERLLTETWMWQNETQSLTLVEYNASMFRLQELTTLPNRIQAHIVNGRQRNQAMQRLSVQAYHNQKELCELANKKGLRLPEEDHRLEEIAALMRAQLKFLQFRARVYDCEHLFWQNLLATDIFQLPCHSTSK